MAVAALSLIDEPRIGNALPVVRRLVETARQNSAGDAIRLAHAMFARAAFRDAWLAFLEEYAVAQRLPSAGIDLLMKPLNQYLLHDLAFAERIRMLRSHYTLLAEFAAPRTILHGWRGDAFDAGLVAGKTGAYVLSLGGTSIFRTRKEGELTVALRAAENDDVLAKLTFLLAETGDGSRALLIGGMQGPRGTAAKQAIIAATRDLNGLRPRDAVLIAAFAIADAIGARQAWAVSNAMHVHRSRDRRQQEKFFVDYDSLWLERGARGALPYGWVFDVPDAPLRTGRTSQGRRRDAMKEIVWRLARTAFTGRPVEEAQLERLAEAVP